MSDETGLSSVRLALAAQAARDAQRPGGEASLFDSEPIAIIGMGCRFPGGANDPEQLWTLLANGIDAVTPVPATRWDPAIVDNDLSVPGKLPTPYAGLIDDVQGFDAEFFGIAPREAVRMDPQQRVLLEVTWDALRDAGCSAAALRGSATGVFVAIYNDDYGRLLYNDWDGIDAHTASGNSHGVSAGRIAYLLDLRGPALAIDTACSSSLVAVHTACRSLRAGETSLAIVNAASLLLGPEQSIALAKWGMMAPDGHCKAFDASADGWVRGEGASALVLKRLADALGDGDRVHAVIRGTALNQDGRSAALTAPNGLAQRAVVRAALANARLSPSRVTYVEAHGTGTSVGDPIELEALVEEIGRMPGAPCLVGTIKANLGHLEASAGLAGMIKVVQALRHERIPPHLHFRQLNPLVSLDGTRLRIERDGAAWPATGELRVAGVSAFGFGGTNAHVIMEEAPRISAAPQVEDGPWLVTLSAHDPVALQQMVDDTVDAVVAHGARDVAWTLTTHDAMRYRIWAVTDSADADSAAELRERLHDAMAHTPVPADIDRRAAFIFSGHGSQWAGMARESLARDEVFAESLRECDSIVHAYAGWSPIAVLLKDADAAQLDDTAIFQPVLIALQLAMADSWLARGVQPAAVLGHSVGEISAACVAGALTRTEALHLAVNRGRLMQELAGVGAMLATEGDETVVRDVAAAQALVIAGENAAGMLTLSGAIDSIDRARTALEAHGITVHRVRVARAFHTPAMHDAANALRARCAALRPRATMIPFYSSVTGSRLDGTQLDALYWERNAREMVRFASATAALLAADIGAVIEVSPHPVLLAPVRATLADRAPGVPLVPTWRRSRGEHSTMLASMGALWCAGVAVSRGQAFREPGNRATLLPYRWQRRAAWAGAPLPLGRPVLSVPREQSIPGRMTEVPSLQLAVFDGVVRADDPVVAGHRVAGRVVVPGTMLLLATLAAAERSAHLLSSTAPSALMLRDVVLDRALSIADGGARAVQITVRVESDDALTFAITSRDVIAAAGTPWERHAGGNIVRSRHDAQSVDIPAIGARCSTPAMPGTVYQRLSESGIALGTPFQLLSTLQLGQDEALAVLRDSASDTMSIAGDAARLDAALHAISALVTADERDAALWLPVSYGEVQVERAAVIAGSHVVLRGAESTSDTRIADVQLYDVDGQSAGTLRGVRLQRTDLLQMARLVGADSEVVFAMQWQSQALPAGTSSFVGEHWLVLEDADDGGTPIADAIVARGGTAVRLSVSATASHADAITHEARMCTAVRAITTLSGVIFAVGLTTPDAPAGMTATDAIVNLAGSALSLLRELVTHATAPKHGVLFVTRGAVSVEGDVTPGSVTGAALWGLRHTAAAEHPELQLRIVDIPMHAAAAAAIVLAECQAANAEPRVAYRGKERLVARLASAPVAIPAVTPLALLPPADRLIEALAPTPMMRQRPSSGMVEIAVEAAGLNFRDVLGALGMVDLPGNALGGECAGVVIAVGDGVTAVAVGDRVLAFALGALRTHVCVAADLVAPMPSWISFAHASALPVAYLTAWYALVRVARVQRGDRVLIHAAAGGVGIAAVHVAHWLGATVTGTAGSPQKRAYLESIGVSAVFDSRTVTFRNALSGTDGRGTIDVVLNSLSDEFIPASLDVLTPNGRFVEIGKRGIWTTDAVVARRPDVAYTVFDLSTLPPDEASLRGGMLREISSLVERGALPPLPTTSFTLAECVNAFRFMAQARHTGKIAITMPSHHEAVRSDGAYVVTGAFGALGRGVVERLVACGARHLVLLSRSGPAGEAAAWLAGIVSRGVEVITETLDVGDGALVREALDRARRVMPALRGIVHTAGVNDDGALITQTAARLSGVVRGKVEGARHLDHLTRQDPIDFFVVFSSASGVLGWPGQLTYSSANTALDQVIALRHASGRPAVSLQWGMWSGGGMVDRVNASARRFATSGMQTLAPEEALDLMMAVRSSARPQLLVTRTDWTPFAATRPRDSHLFDGVRHTTSARVTSSSAPVAHTTSLVTGISALPESLRADAIRDAMMKLAARALGLPASARVDATRALRDLGLDSLMAVELRNAIGTAVERTLPATLLFEHASVDALSEYVWSLLRPVALTDAKFATTTSAPPREPRVDVSAAASADEVAEMSDDEAEALLREELAASRATSYRPLR